MQPAGSPRTSSRSSADEAESPARQADSHDDVEQLARQERALLQPVSSPHASHDPAQLPAKQLWQAESSNCTGQVPPPLLPPLLPLLVPASRPPLLPPTIPPLPPPLLLLALPPPVPPPDPWVPLQAMSVASPVSAVLTIKFRSSDRIVMFLLPRWYQEPAQHDDGQLVFVQVTRSLYSSMVVDEYEEAHWLRQLESPLSQPSVQEKRPSTQSVFCAQAST